MALIRTGTNAQTHGDQVATAFDGTHGDTVGPVYIAGRRRVTVWAFTVGTGWEVTLEVSPNGTHFAASSVKLTPTAQVAVLPELPCHSVQATISFPTQPARKVVVAVIGE